MTSYKEKIQKELKKAIEHYKFHQTRSVRTRHIHKEGKTKRVFKSRNSFHQQVSAPALDQSPHVLNFYNIFAINEKAIRDSSYHESYIQTSFYFKTIRKIEIKQNYVVLFLNDSGLLPSTIQETISKYKSDQNEQLRNIGSMLQSLNNNLHVSSLNHQSDISLTNQAYQILDSLGTVPFICKIFSFKLVISRSLLDLQGYNSEQFLIECLKYKLPLFECFSSQNYYNLVRNQVDFYTQLISDIHGLTNFKSLSQKHQFNFEDTITSKNNSTYRCDIAFTMPIPLVELIQVKQILSTTQTMHQIPNPIIDTNFRRYQLKTLQRQRQTLRHLKLLPSNFQPQNKLQIASYQYLPQDNLSHLKFQQDDRKSNGSSCYKVCPTISNIEETPHYICY